MQLKARIKIYWSKKKNMKEIIAKTIDRISGVVPEDRVLRDEPMSRHTSFRIGGPAEAFIIVNNEEELAAVLAIVTETGAQHMIIGNGSNLLVSDEGYPGIMIKLGGDFESIVRNEDDPCRVKSEQRCSCRGHQRS